VKRGGPLQRRTPLARGEGLRRDTPGARAWTSKARTPIAPRSSKRIVEDRERAKVMARVRDRDGGRCQLAAGFGTPCFGEIHGHEIVKASAWRSGRLDESNIVLACNRHNGDVEDHPALAESLGFVRRSR